MAPVMTNYKILAAAKKAVQQDKIPKSWRILAEKFQDVSNVMDVPLSCGLLDEKEAKITSNYDATALLEKLKARVWSVEQVTVAFCKRAAIAHQLTNCLTEIFFDDAIERAKKLDLEYGQMSRDALPPLFGLPISLKDSFQVSGYDTSTGMGCYVHQPAEENSALAAMLIDLGAVLYCKTNLPQTIMTGDTDNNIFGRTLNPRNKSLTAGGSTGGEGALIALRGSILGFGTDIGGSIRVPAVCNGIYGFRPSVGLIPHDGVRDVTTPGTDGIRSTAGPMATSLRDCSLLLKTVMQADTWKYDSTSISIPWTDLRPVRKLRIGVAQNDGVFTPSPPVRRALDQSVDLLRGNDSIEIIPITLPNVGLHYQDIMRYFALLGNDYYYEQFARTGEPAIPSLENIGLLSLPGTDLKGFFDLNVRRAEAAKNYLKLFRDNEIDVILMPPAPHTAVPLDTWVKAAYSSLWNYLDYPAIVVPTDHVRDTDSTDDLSNAQFGLEDKKLYSLYTGPEQYKDAPVGIMVVGYKHKDESLLNAAAVLDSILNKH
ncbi:fatty-acid amide hydrolase, putative [Talaromyces marneffei ATCC 18224]|uniref:Fatty-acid amide hydrolase, putative n=1 Tax=Talaromyces marneffei (strain ATCC 18224 / CBS 334.59 / QM 7333) TaxID=441960 RepID=B6QGG0_TALMQ|nr:fatty-acid amide hydrolase, putative [Talaromyces marneffei ATCC 18224]